MPVSDLKLSYEPAMFEDIPVIFSMAKDLIDTYEDTSNIDYDKVIGWMLNKITRNITDYQCVLANGIKAGYYRLSPKNGSTELDDLYIMPEFRGRGIGTAVLQRCISEAESALFLYVFTENQGAINLYSRMGFSVSEDVGKTRCIMRREVDRPTA